MLIKCDAAQLEWRTVLFLSQDKVGIQEILDGVDAHSRNQEAFLLPSRLIAKVFLFRIIFGGSAYSFAHDPDFDGIGNVKFWERVIDKFYEKYHGIYKYHLGLMQKATATGKLIIPTGREFVYKPLPNYKGELEWPRTQILNHSTQGCAADLMALCRVTAASRLKSFPPNEVKLVATVHDDLVVDCTNEHVYNICTVLEQTFTDIPQLFQKFFKKPFNVPMGGEASYGHNLSEMTKYSR